MVNNIPHCTCKLNSGDNPECPVHTASLRAEDYEYTETTTNRKGTELKPEGEGWSQYDFQRDDFTDTYYYRRPKNSTTVSDKNYYVVVKNPEIELFESQLNARAQQGYRIVGTPFFANNRLCAVMERAVYKQPEAES